MLCSSASSLTFLSTQELSKEITTGNNFFDCDNCGTKSRYSQLHVVITARVSFPGKDDNITIFNLQLKEYASRYDLN